MYNYCNVTPTWAKDRRKSLPGPNENLDRRFLNCLVFVELLCALVPVHPERSNDTGAIDDLNLTDDDDNDLDSDDDDLDTDALLPDASCATNNPLLPRNHHDPSMPRGGGGATNTAVACGGRFASFSAPSSVDVESDDPAPAQHPAPPTVSVTPATPGPPGETTGTNPAGGTYNSSDHEAECFRKHHCMSR